MGENCTAVEENQTQPWGQSQRLWEWNKPKPLLTNTSMSRCSRVTSKSSSLAANVITDDPICSEADGPNLHPLSSENTAGAKFRHEAELPLMGGGNP